MAIRYVRNALLISVCFVGSAVADPIRSDTSVVEQRRPAPPTILIDRSHEWQFSYDDLADRMLCPDGFDVVMSDASLGETGPLNNYEAVVVQQTKTRSVVSRREADMLKKYVLGGGRLLLVTKPDLPMEAVAKDFGFSIERSAGQKPLKATGALISHGSPETIPTRRIPYTLRTKTGTSVLVTDAVGKPVAAVRRYGSGLVLLWPDDGAYWDFVSQRDANMKVASAPATVALFRYITGNPDRPKKGRARRVLGEFVERHGSFVLRYSRPNEEATRLLRSKMPKIVAEVEKWNGGPLPASPDFTVNFLSGGGGGYAGRNAIGVGTIGEPAYMVKVMAHEMTHTTTGPMPWIFGEGWASMVGMRVAETLGYSKSDASERKQWADMLEKADPQRNMLDIMQSDAPGKKNQAYEAKAMWMIEQLEAKYDGDFIARFLERREQEFGSRKKIDLTQTLQLFSRTAGQDLTAWYKSIGTTIQPQ